MQRSVAQSSEMEVHPIGIGTIWCGRQWPPGNTDHVEATQEEVEGFLRRGVEACTAAGRRAMVDTAEGYGRSEERVGAWLKGNPEIGSKVVIATKFGEQYNLETGETSVDLSASAATRCLDESLKHLGRVDIFYSHVTSQISAEAARGVLTDPELKSTLESMKRSGRVGAIGTSISHTEVVLEGLSKGWFDGMDAVQLPAPMVLGHPEIAAGLAERKVLVVVNSVIRKMKAVENGPSTPEGMFKAVLGVKGVGCCLTGTRNHLDETLGYYDGSAAS